MGEKIELGKPQLYIGNTPINTEPIDAPFLLSENGWKDEKKLSIPKSVSFDIPMTEELKKLQDTLLDDFSRSYEQWLRDVEAAVTKILTKYIDEPFTTDWKEATKEEFEKRHIKALVYQEL